MRRKYFSMFVAMLTLLMCIMPQRLMADTVTQQQIDAAYAAITSTDNLDADGQLWYRIYTYCISGETKEMGTTRYYLTAGGTLTIDEEEAGTFLLVQVPAETGGFASNYNEKFDPAFYVKNGANYFTNANRAIGGNIRTSTNGRATFEAQVFFLNDDGYYAIRSTNASAGSWWEAAWWTVGNEGVACYTEPDENDGDITHAAFIWELELAEANDYVNLDETKTYSLSFTQIKAGSEYKYLLSPSYYEEAGYTDQLIHRTNMRSKQMEIKATATDQKNTFYLQDVISKMYIMPNATSVSGAEWTISETPSPVVLSYTGIINTYTLAGETGGLANPLGNDTAPYTVGNYNGSNYVLFTPVETGQSIGYVNYIQPAYDALTATANASEDGEFWYRIYTTSEDGKTFGQTKFYLTTSGTLTEDDAAAGSFQFISLGDNSDGLYTKAFKVRSGANYFTNANKASGTSILRSTNSRDTYEAQVFCLKDGKYAVRSTNAAPADYWEQSWWTVSARGICCYTNPSDEEAAYIWEVEKAEAAADAVRFDETLTYTISVNKDLSFKYIQSPAFNAEGDKTIRRTDNSEQAFKAGVQAVEGKKNTFYIVDKTNGLYVSPAMDKLDGTVWTWSEFPAPVIFLETSPGLFIMQGEKGGFANAYNDDRESAGYPVANYNTASTWIFTADETGDENIDEMLLTQMQDAAITIGENTYLKVFTSAISGESEAEGTKFYLTAEGSLTSDSELAAVFNFISAGEVADGFCNYAYFVKNGANYFTNADRTEGANLRTVTSSRPTYDAQVFLMNEDELFAVRSTNANIGSYWEDAWWNATLAEDGTPMACYTQPGIDNIKYIWQIEEAEPNDLLTFDADATYTITLNKTAIEHKFIQSSLYNETDDNIIRRTAEGEQAVKLTITAVEGKKNVFVMKDSKTGLCLTPAADAEVGEEWTYSEYGEVSLELVRDNIYLMGGENGSKANAFGDDKEEEGYRVAHYGVASQWIITVAGSEEDPVGLDEINMNSASSDTYNMLGMRTKNASKGMYIVGGRKVVINK